jgi:hypothetical protein
MKADEMRERAQRVCDNAPKMTSAHEGFCIWDALADLADELAALRAILESTGLPVDNSSTLCGVQSAGACCWLPKGHQGPHQFYFAGSST